MQSVANINLYIFASKSFHSYYLFLIIMDNNEDICHLSRRKKDQIIDIYRCIINIFKKYINFVGGFVYHPINPPYDLQCTYGFGLPVSRFGDFNLCCNEQWLVPFLDIPASIHFLYLQPGQGAFLGAITSQSYVPLKQVNSFFRYRVRRKNP